MSSSSTPVDGVVQSSKSAGKGGGRGSYCERARQEAKVKRHKAAEPTEKKTEEYIYFNCQDDCLGLCYAYAVPVTLLTKLQITIEYIDKEMLEAPEVRFSTFVDIKGYEGSLWTQLMEYAETNKDSGIEKLNEMESVPLHKYNFVRAYLPQNC